MNDLIEQLLGYLRGMWQRRWVGVAVAWAVGLAGAAAVLQTPDKFEASTRLSLDAQSILKPLMSGLAVQPDMSQQVAMLSRTLISRPNVEKLVRNSGLDAQTNTPQERDSLVDGLMKSIRLSSLGRDNLFTISYRHSDPAQAEKVVASMVAMFLESSAGDKREDADAARRFIEEQIKIYEQRLDEAENRLKEFRLKNMGIASADGKDYFTRMTQASEELAKARLELRAAEQSRDALKRELAGEEPVFLPDMSSTQPVAVPEIDGRLDALRKRLDELLRQYTDQHPDVLGTKRVIEQLEAQRRNEIEARRRAAQRQGGTMVANPFIEQLKVSLAGAEANIAALRTRVAEHAAQYERLRASAQRVPQVEAELAQLNRDYEVQKRNYESLVSRRESAALSSQMGAAGGSGAIRVVDPPRVAREPVAPNRQLLLPLVLLASLLAGVGASLVASQISPTVANTRTLRELTGRAVLGVVSLLPSEKRARNQRQGNLAFAGSLGALLCVFGALHVFVSAASRLS